MDMWYVSWNTSGSQYIDHTVFMQWARELFQSMHMNMDVNLVKQLMWLWVGNRNADTEKQVKYIDNKLLEEVVGALGLTQICYRGC